MKKFRIFAGLEGGFGGPNYVKTCLYKNKEDAEQDAYQYAIEEYESYAGLHGIRSLNDIAEEEDLDLDDERDLKEAEEIYNEDLESWIDFYVEEVKEGELDIPEGYE